MWSVEREERREAVNRQHPLVTSIPGDGWSEAAFPCCGRISGARSTRAAFTESASSVILFAIRSRQADTYHRRKA
jgi:hypothetical protein